MADFLTRIGDPLPYWLQEYVVSFMRNAPVPMKRGRKKATNALRDVTIVQAVAMLANAHDLQPTRNAATADAAPHVECACSILSQALEAHGLKMTEANVAAIWAQAGGSKVLMDADRCEDPCFALLAYDE